MAHVGLISCVSRKRAKALKAEDLYTSPLFIKARQYAERHFDQRYVLSAKHGLVEPGALKSIWRQAGLEDER